MINVLAKIAPYDAIGICDVYYMQRSKASQPLTHLSSDFARLTIFTLHFGSYTLGCSFGWSGEELISEAVSGENRTGLVGGVCVDKTGAATLFALASAIIAFKSG